ncbi:MAG: uridine kinase [Bacilli bacterium]|nr:uridine kinase [Bacilli bacterium]
MSRIILVAGGSSSGKTYVTSEVLSKLNSPDITRISLDDYYHDHSNLTMEERASLNYDHPKAFDWKLMRQQVRDLKNGKAIEKPMYDFVVHNRKKETEIVKPTKVIVLEGLMALVDKELRDLGDIKIFIQASYERRFLRRIIRDRKERGRSFESIVEQYFTTVAPMYGEIVSPSIQYADLIVNNDGVENRAIDILTSIFRQEIECYDNPSSVYQVQQENFTEEVLAESFKK